MIDVIGAVYIIVSIILFVICAETDGEVVRFSTVIFWPIIFLIQFPFFIIVLLKESWQDGIKMLK
jgi:hypothetical protein